MADLSENPSECSGRPAANRTKYSVWFCQSAAVPCSFSIVFDPSAVTVMPVQTLPKLAKLQVCFQKFSGGGEFSLFT